MKKLDLLACTVLAFTLISCAPDHGSKYQAGSAAHPLLESEGEWTIVEEETQISPDQMHMQARTQVDPGQQVADADRYTDHYRAADLNEDTRYRVLRLEKRVDTMDRDFKQLLPPLKKLIVPGDDLGPAIGDIESRRASVTSTPPITERKVETTIMQAPPAKLTPVPAGPAPDVVSPAAPGAPTITDIRSGEHAGKTRLVLDTNGPVSYKYDVDNNEKLLLIELGNAGLAAPVQKNFGNSAFLKSYTAQTSGGGVTLAVELKKPAKILNAAALKPEGAQGNHRVFFDIGAP